MKKKIIYSLIGVAVIVLGYLNYFADEQLPEGNAPIETFNTRYENEEYRVEAKKQLDYLRTRETRFEFGQLELLKERTRMIADDIFIDSDNNIEFRKNIHGYTENGWEIQSEKLDYNKINDEITTDEGIRAINAERNVSIGSRIYKSDSRATYIDMEREVTLTVDKITATGDKGSYREDSGIVTLEGNIRLGGTDRNNNSIGGNMIKLAYNLETKTLESNEAFDIVYRGIKLLGERLLYEEFSQALEITDNVVFEVADYKVNADRIIKEEESTIVKIYGPIFGGNEESQMEADEGIYDIEKKELYVYGNVKIITKNNEELTSEQLVLNDENSSAIALGTEEKPVIFKSDDGILTTTNLIYNFANNDLFMNEKYKVDGVQYDSEGEKGYYNTVTKIGEITNGYILDKKENRKLSGSSLKIDELNEVYAGNGNVVYEDSQYILKAEEIEHINKDGKGKIRGKYIMSLKENNISYYGEDATYDSISGDFVDEGLIIVRGENFETVGENLRYNSKSGEGYFESEMLFTNTKNGTTITGEHFSFQKDNFVKISGSIVIESEKLVAKSVDGYYDLKKEEIDIPNEIIITGKENEFDGRIERGIYKVDEGIFYGEKFTGKYEEYDLESDKIHYSTIEGKISMIDNAEIVSRLENGNKIYGDRLEYSSDKEIVEAHSGYTIYYNKNIITGKDIVYNMQFGTLIGIEINILSEEGDAFYANEVDGLMREMRLDFIGDAKANVVSQGEAIDFTGDFVRIYFKGVKNKLTPVRSEAKGNVTFIQEGMEARAEYMEYDLEKEIIFAEENVFLHTKDEKDGEITARGDKGNVFLKNDTASLMGKVYVKNIDLYKKVTEAYGDNAKIDRGKNTLEFLGNVRIEASEGFVTAERVIYNMETRKVNAKGNVYVEQKK